MDESWADLKTFRCEGEEAKLVQLSGGGVKCELSSVRLRSNSPLQQIKVVSEYKTSSCQTEIFPPDLSHSRRCSVFSSVAWDGSPPSNND